MCSSDLEIMQFLLNRIFRSERIAATALLKLEKIWTLPIPARHHHLIQSVAALAPESLPVRADEQGFLTDSGRFVSREEGLTIARQSGQIRSKHPPMWQLCSEDMW